MPSPLKISKKPAFTGIGLTDAKAALVDADGDFDKVLKHSVKRV